MTETAPSKAIDLQRLHKALAIEADRGFENMQGRQSRFADFLVDTLDIEPPEAWEFDADERRKWRELGAQYRLYPELERGARQRLVAETRRWLYQMRKQLEPPPAPKSKLPYFGKTELTLDRPLQFLKGIGPKSAEKLAKLHLLTAEDALHYFPRDHVNYANRQAIARAEVGTTITIVGQVRSCTCFTSPRNKNLSIFTLKVRDDSGSMQLSRFFAGRQFSNRGWQERMLRQYPRGATIAASGLVKHSKYGITLDDPQIEVLADETADIRSLKIGKILPIYPLTEGIDANLVRKAVQAALPAVVCLEDPMPEALRRSLDLLGLQQAIAGFHFPTDNDHLERARRRLVFDEFFYLQLGLLLRRQQYRQQSAEVPRYAPRDGDLLQKFYDILPFPLTNAQRRVVDELLADMRATDPMNRLVQGDVGAGKTVVAVAALLAAIQSGWQTTLMAPTEVLAEQHYRKLVEWFGQLHVPVELLTGSTPTAKRREILRQLETGELSLLVGTHALIQPSVTFSQLGLVIIDEQHRFGVSQRAALQAKGDRPDVLTMTATPIPRTLTLSLHGDLDVSQIDELPPGRKPIHTSICYPRDRDRVYELVKRELAQGRQTYVVLPLVEESEKLDLKSATAERERLQDKVFPQFSVGLLHGRMSSADKDEVIQRFRDRQLDILVSTTVVEVGVDVPNASLMLIEHAERFGLSQLHQLRGRVGRGAAQSFCILMTQSKAENARQRLKVLEQSNDGFFIAEMDLRLRGPGEVLGTRQSGLPDFALASLIDDRDTLELARQTAEDIIARSPDLERYPQLRQSLHKQYVRLMGGAIFT